MRRVQPLTPEQPAELTVAARIGLTQNAQLVLGSNLKAEDDNHRWRIANTANLIWAAQNTIPVPVVSGPLSVGVVASAILWDRTHPPRVFHPAVHHLKAELMLLAKQGRLSVDRRGLNNMLDWLRLTLNANSCAL